MAATNQSQLHPIPLADDALRTILSFLSFSELQQTALLNSQLTAQAILRAKDVIRQAGTGGNYSHFVEWRRNTVNLLHAERRHDALARIVINSRRMARAQAQREAIIKRPSSMSALLRLQDIRKELKRLKKAVVRDTEIKERANSVIGANDAWAGVEHERVNTRGRRRRRVVMQGVAKRKRM